MEELNIEELRECLIKKVSEKEDALLILSTVSGIPQERIDYFLQDGDIALQDFIVLKSLV